MTSESNLDLELASYTKRYNDLLNDANKIKESDIKALEDLQKRIHGLYVQVNEAYHRDGVNKSNGDTLFSEINKTVFNDIYTEVYGLYFKIKELRTKAEAKAKEAAFPIMEQALISIVPPCQRLYDTVYRLSPDSPMEKPIEFSQEQITALLAEAKKIQTDYEKIEKEFGTEIYKSVYYMGKSVQKVIHDLNEAYPNSPKTSPEAPPPPRAQ